MGLRSGELGVCVVFDRLYLVFNLSFFLPILGLLEN